MNDFGNYAYYRIFEIDGKTQLHHITCSRSDTKLIEWPNDIPGGMPMSTILMAIDGHSRNHGVNTEAFTPPF